MRGISRISTQLSTAQAHFNGNYGTVCTPYRHINFMTWHARKAAICAAARRSVLAVKSNDVHHIPKIPKSDHSISTQLWGCPTGIIKALLR